MDKALTLQSLAPASQGLSTELTPRWRLLEEGDEQESEDGAAAESTQSEWCTGWSRREQIARGEGAGEQESARARAASVSATARLSSSSSTGRQQVCPLLGLNV